MRRRELFGKTEHVLTLTTSTGDTTFDAAYHYIYIDIKIDGVAPSSRDGIMFSTTGTINGQTQWYSSSTSRIRFYMPANYSTTDDLNAVITVSRGSASASIELIQTHDEVKSTSDDYTVEFLEGTTICPTTWELKRTATTVTTGCQGNCPDCGICGRAMQHHTEKTTYVSGNVTYNYYDKYSDASGWSVWQQWYPQYMVTKTPPCYYTQWGGSWCLNMNWYIDSIDTVNKTMSLHLESENLGITGAYVTFSVAEWL